MRPRFATTVGVGDFLCRFTGVDNRSTRTGNRHPHRARRIYLHGFPKATDFQGPVWPPIEGSQCPMMHLDFRVGDLDSASAEVVELGATLAGHQPQENLRAMLDPFGHTFCLCRDDG